MREASYTVLPLSLPSSLPPSLPPFLPPSLPPSLPPRLSHMSSDDLLREKAEFEHTLDSCLSTSESCDSHTIQLNVCISYTLFIHAVFLELMVNIY